ncbi:MAG: Mut7-C RNAse domain-containing protein, partial [Calditrichota bacterium]
MLFLADNDLGRLARLLRMLGFDCRYEGGAARSELIAIAVEDQRLLITRRPIAESKRLRVLKIENSHPDKQLLEIIEKCELGETFQFFTRCLECNLRLQPITSRNDSVDLASNSTKE